MLASTMRFLSYLPPWLDPVLPPHLDRRPKIFGIGFHKTGTTSLGRALRDLGFRVHKGFSINMPGKRVRIPEPVTLAKIQDVALPIVPYYSAFQDNPWPLLFDELDRLWPGSRFVLTTRDPERWYRSAARFHNGRKSRMLDFIYGQRDLKIAENKELCLRRFNAHNEKVKAYFKDRPDDLLCWDLEAEPNWYKLCAFLDVPVPARDFPHGKQQTWS
jgi:Sulfotransferase domain